MCAYKMLLRLLGKRSIPHVINRTGGRGESLREQTPTIPPPIVQHRAWMKPCGVKVPRINTLACDCLIYSQVREQTLLHPSPLCLNIFAVFTEIFTGSYFGEGIVQGETISHLQSILISNSCIKQCFCFK